jgi:hypothetical protein
MEQQTPSIIPDKNLFIVTSALKPVIGVISQPERLSQTLDTLHDLRNKVPDAIICFADCSVNPVPKVDMDLISQYCDIFMDVSTERATQYFSQNGMKSHAENALLFAVLLNLRNDPQFGPLMKTVNRIFKYSARSSLTSGFDISHYENYFGKYVFKTRVPSWTHDKDNLLITRLFSFCPSLLDNYLEVIQKNMPLLDTMDTEHAHWVNIPKDRLVEFDRLFCSGIMAGTGQTEQY